MLPCYDGSTRSENPTTGIELVCTAYNFECQFGFSNCPFFQYEGSMNHEKALGHCPKNFSQAGKASWQASLSSVTHLFWVIIVSFKFAAQSAQILCCQVHRAVQPKSREVKFQQFSDPQTNPEPIHDLWPRVTSPWKLALFFVDPGSQLLDFLFFVQSSSNNLLPRSSSMMRSLPIDFFERVTFSSVESFTVKRVSVIGFDDGVYWPLLKLPS